MLSIFRYFGLIAAVTISAFGAYGLENHEIDLIKKYTKNSVTFYTQEDIAHEIAMEGVLVAAIKDENIEDIRAFLDMGVDPNDYGYRTQERPLPVALSQKNDTITHMLLDAGAIAVLTDLETIWQNRNIEIARKIAKEQPDADWVNIAIEATKEKETKWQELLHPLLTEEEQLYYAAGIGHMDFIQENISNAAISKQLQLALNFAALHGQNNVIEYLLNQNVRMTPVAENQSSTLNWASKGNHDAVVQQLMEHGAQVTLQDFYHAWHNNNLALAKIFAEKIGQIPGAFSVALAAREDENKQEWITWLETYILDDNRFFYDIAAGNTDAVQQTLQTEDVNKMNKEGNATPLIYAILYQQKEIFDLLLAEGADINIPFPSAPSPLFYSFQEDDLYTAQQLIKAGASIADVAQLMDVPNFPHYDMLATLIEEGSLTPEQAGFKPKEIFQSCGYGTYSIPPQNAKAIARYINALAQKGYDIDQRGDYGETLLIDVAECGDSGHEVLKVLVQHKADVNATTSAGTALSAAVRNNSPLNVKLLLDAGAKPNLGSSFSGSPIHALFSSHNNGTTIEQKREILHMLLEKGAFLEAKANGITAFNHLIHTISTADEPIEYRLATAQILLDAGADIHAEDFSGESLILTITKMLEQYVLHQDDAVNFAEDAQIVKLRTTAEFLLKNKIGANAQDSKQQTALMYAASAGDIALVQMLFDYGADVNLTSYAGLGALHFAALKGSVELLEILIDHGADVNMRGTSDRLLAYYPIEFLIKEWNDKGVAYLISKGADVNVKSDGGQSMLHIAAQTNEDIVQLLLDAGADINATDEAGKTALDYAETPEIHALLMLHMRK